MSLKYLYVPSGYKAGKTYGVLPNEANADLAFVRDSTATRINANGLVETMGNNVPRLDYTDGSCPTLLTEPASTNLVEYSEDFSQWITTVSGTGVAPVISTGFSAPDGSSNARKIVFDKGAGNTASDICLISDGYTSESDTYTQTVWMRTESGTANVLMDFDSANSNEVTVTTTWQRMTLTKSVSSTTSRTLRIGLRGGSSTVDSATILIWGAQLEKQPYATSYIYNNGTALGVTRAADTGVISGDLSSYINSSEGVLEIKAKALFNGGSGRRITLSDGSSTNRINLIWSSSANTMLLGMIVNGSLVFDGGATFSKSFTHDQTEMATFKIKWKSGDIQVKVNGTVVLTQTDTFTILGLDRIRLDAGFGSATELFEGNVQYIKVYDSITDF